MSEARSTYDIPISSYDDINIPTDHLYTNDHPSHGRVSHRKNTYDTTIATYDVLEHSTPIPKSQPQLMPMPKSSPPLATYDTHDDHSNKHQLPSHDPTLCMDNTSNVVRGWPSTTPLEQRVSIIRYKHV